MFIASQVSKGKGSMTSLELKDSLKAFYDGGVSKHIPPDLTFQYALNRMERLPRPILARYFEVEAPSGIPQFVFVGTEHFREYVASAVLTNGKGHSESQALASGIMEMTERYSCYKHCSPGNPHVVMISALDALQNNPFRTEDLFSLLNPTGGIRSDYDDEVRRARLALYQGYVLDGRAAYLPLSFLRYLSGTNGMAAGNTLEEALLHGICEVVERHCLAMVRQKRLPTASLQWTSIGNPVARDLMERLRKKSRGLLVKDFSLGWGIPVIGLVRKVDEKNCLVTAGVASSPDEALVRALTENSQIEDPTHFERTSSVPYHFDQGPQVTWDQMPRFDHGNVKIELERIHDILNEQKMKVFFVETTDEELKIPSAMVFISGAKPGSGHGSRSGFILEGLLFESLVHGDSRGARRFVDIGRTFARKGQDSFLYYRGMIHLAAGEYKQAIKDIKDGLKGDMDSQTRASCLAAMAICYFLEHRMDAAVDQMLDLSKAHPGFCLEWIARHQCREGAGTNKKTTCFCCLYNELLGLKYWSGAEEGKLKSAFKEYIVNRPRVLARLQNARTHFEAGRYERAIGEALEAVQIDPISAKIHNIHHLLGLCHMGMEKWRDAVRELKQAAEVTAGDLRVLRPLSQCLQHAAENNVDHGRRVFPTKGVRVFRIKKLSVDSKINGEEVDGALASWRHMPNERMLVEKYPKITPGKRPHRVQARNRNSLT